MENNTPLNPQEETKPKVDTSSIYPEPKSTRPAEEPTANQGSNPAPTPTKASSSKKVYVPVSTIIGVVVAFGLGLVLGMTVFKPAPTPEEAAEVMFGEAFGELSDELSNFDFSEADFETQ